MSSSLQNARCKMLFKLSILVISLSAFKTASATDLVDLPLSTARKSVNINATLTDINAGTKYFVQEFISASDKTIKGKIVISGEKDSYNIYYNTDASFSKKRLVIHGTNCLPFTYKDNWDQTLPGIKRPVANLVLLMGPSILYRLGHSSIVWKSAADKNIRGAMMKGATTKINNRLKITYYYKKHFDDDYGIKNPSRIEFSGYDPSSKTYNYDENLILDIYHQNEHYYDKHKNEVHPLPGIGCPYYLSTSELSFPRLRTHYVHYTMYEHIKGSTTTRTFSEIHVSRRNNLLRLKANVLGITTEAIYDYVLGVSYLFGEGGSCKVLSADLNSPGISSDGYFTLENLFLLDFPFKYIGKLNLEYRSGFPVDAWEAIEYNVSINGKEADKAVITQYFAASHDSQIFPGYTLVSTKIAIYKLDSLKKTYTLTDEITRDYINFEQAGSEDEFHDIFSLKECKYLSSDKKLTLAFKLQPEDDNRSSQKLTKSHVYELKQDFMFNVIPYETISKLRIDNVQYNFNDALLEMEVTFLDIPNLQNIFNSKTMSVSAYTFSKMEKIRTNNEIECLDKLSKVMDNIKVVIYRPSDFVCGYLTNVEDLEEDTKTGKPCSVYHFPLHNLQRINQELSLDQIHNTFLQDVGKSYWLLSLENENKLGYYKLIDVIDKTKNQVASTDFYLYSIKIGAKINSNNQDTAIVPDVKTLADCYRTCHDSEQLKCNTFSFCSNGECRVSSVLTDDALDESHVEKEDACTIYALNVLNDYSEVRHRIFKTQTSTAVEKSLYSCGEYCKASPDCFSFQWCDFQCSFGGFYTDAATEYDGECNVYHPKVSEKFQKTGNKIVSDVIYTEMNLNFEQCASLCHGWSYGETGCKSFNYCPKGKTESSCSLTQFSAKSSNTKTIEGGDCSNYELKGESKKRKESSSTDVMKGTTGSGAFGIIMLFLFVGALLGFAAPFGYIKVKQMRNASEDKQSFTWARHVDEQGADQL